MVRVPSRRRAPAPRAHPGVPAGPLLARLARGGVVAAAALHLPHLPVEGLGPRARVRSEDVGQGGAGRVDAGEGVVLGRRKAHPDAEKTR